MLNRKGSLRTRLLILFIGVLILGGAVLMLAAYNFSQRAADQAYDKLLASAALTAMESVSIIEGEIQFDLPYASLETLAQSRNDRVVYRLLQNNDEMLTGYSELPDTNAPEQMQDDFAQGRPHFFTEDHDGETFRFVILERLLLESGVQGKVHLQMGQSRLAREQLAQDLSIKALLGIRGLTALVCLFVWWSAGWILRPVLRVEDELLQRQPTDLQPLTTQVPQEINHLVDAINRFMGRLQRNQDRNHAFIAEAAHQLRTPLASLQAQAELAAEDQDAAVLQGRARRIHQNALATNKRIRQLLNYATLAHRADVQLPQAVVLADVVVDCLADLAPLALQQNVELDFDNGMGEQEMVVDPEAIQEMLRNLVDNALKYGQQQGSPRRIQISLQDVPEMDWVILQVRDYGAGLPEELLAQVTRRFGRGEFRQSKGSGLGLAIVEQIMYGLGGRLELENGVQGGLKARLLLKLGEADS